jgi:hypothetical protein
MREQLDMKSRERKNMRFILNAVMAESERICSGLGSSAF